MHTVPPKTSLPTFIRKEFITICCICNRLQKEDGDWEFPSRKLQTSGDNVNHSFCIKCMEKHYPVVYNNS